MIQTIGEIARRANRCGSARPLVAVLTVLLASLALAATAGAFPQRGYVYNEGASFGTTGSAAGQMLHPAGIAVNQATGDIYVMDAGNNRVDQFDATHKFVRAWGTGVGKEGSNVFEVCTTVCFKGKAGHKKGELHGAGAIAVDSDPSSPSFGDVYVEIKPYEEEINEKELEFEYGLIQKYNGQTGAFVTAIKGWKEKGESLERFEEPHGIAVGEQGELFVYNEEEEMFEFDNAVENKFTRLLEYEVEGEASDGVAAGANGIVYIAHGELSSSENPPKLIGKYKIGKEEEDSEEEVLLGINESIVPEPSTNVAVSPATQDVLVDTGTNIVILDEAGNPVQRLGAGTESGALQKSTGAAANNKSGEVVAADAALNRVTVFSPEPAGRPRIEEAGSSHTAATSVDLTATIAPGGLPTTYWFRYSTEAVPPASQPCTSPCVEVPIPHADLAEGAEGNFADVVAAPIEVAGLTPKTLYHYIAFAANEGGAVESAEQSFKTQPAVLGEALPDGRSWQLVSPFKGKNGASLEAPAREGGLIQAAGDGKAITYIATTAFEGAEGNRAPEPNQILSVRHDNGEASSWSSRDINTPNSDPTGLAPGSPSEYQWFTTDLSESVVFPRSLVDLSPEANELTAYKRTNFGSCETEVPVSSDCYRPLVNTNNVTAETEVEGKKVKVAFGGQLGPVPYMTPSGQFAVVESKRALTTEPTVVGSENLYEWSAATGGLKLVNQLTNGTPLPSAKLGAQSKLTRNAVSADGSRVTFAAGTPAHLYQRNTVSGKTLQVDTPEEGVIPGGGKAKYQTQSEDGKTIFFYSTQKLTKNAAAQNEPAKPDLYVCEVEETAGEPKCKLTDLTAGAGEPANAQGGVPGAAADGSTVFFVANGALAGGAAKGNCKDSLNEQTQDTEVILANVCNLYVRHRTGFGTWASPKLIATLSIEDEPDWGLGPSNDPGLMTSRVSPNGEWLAFMSDRRLPTATNPAGYNNHDANSGRADEEVFLYNASSEKLVCASCDPTGARPVGVHDLVESGEGFGMLVDRPQIWKSKWIAANIPGWTKLGVTTSFYQSRYLLNSGRLYFNSSQALVPQDENGSKQDVYQYEPAGTTGPDGAVQCTEASDTFGEGSLGCVGLISSGRDSHESAFLDASESGNDVFFLTAAPLAKLDGDFATDVYDASVCGLAGLTQSCVPPPAALPPPCTECKEGATDPGSIGGTPPGTLAASGSGNSTKHEVLGATEEKKPTTTPKPLTRAQKYSKALKACKKIKSKSKRAKCVAAAKKKYGPKKAAKKGSVKR